MGAFLFGANHDQSTDLAGSPRLLVVPDAGVCMRHMNRDISQKRLMEVLEYFPDTGVFVWKKRIGSVSAGDIARNVSDKGYVKIKVDKKTYSAHRLAFLYMTGRLPTEHVDHINGNRSDFRWENLREATQGQNNQNLTRCRVDSKTGFIGVSKLGDRYRARISLNGKRVSVGMADSAIGAHRLYLEAKRKIHPFCTI